MKTKKNKEILLIKNFIYTITYLNYLKVINSYFCIMCGLTSHLYCNLDEYLLDELYCSSSYATHPFLLFSICRLLSIYSAAKGPFFPISLYFVIN